MIGAPPITSRTFQEYVIPFWFREAIFRQDASLGFLSDKKRSTENTGYNYVLVCSESTQRIACIQLILVYNNMQIHVLRIFFLINVVFKKIISNIKYLCSRGDYY